jgi:hypothetical protein
MGTRATVTVLVLGLWLTGGISARGAEQPRALTPDEIKRRVNQLGAASTELVKKVKEQLIEIGSPALAPLRAAAFTSDVEPLRRGANEVIAQIGNNAQKKLEAQLAKVNATGAKVYRITGEALARVFPSHLFFAVRFPMYPMAVRPRAPLVAQNLFIVDREGQMEHVTDFKGINTFFTENIGKVLKGNDGKNPAKAWLALGQELIQDGYFTFTVPDEEIKIGRAAVGPRIIARAVVKPEKRNGGFLQIRLDFGLTGDLDTLAYSKEITTGERPK